MVEGTESVARVRGLTARSDIGFQFEEVTMARLIQLYSTEFEAAKQAIGASRAAEARSRRNRQSTFVVRVE
jgi:hypothetical protein